MKIAIIGYSGSGKTTLAKILGEIYDADVMHLDSVQFISDWKIRDKEEQRQIVNDFLDSHDAWIIEGNYKNLSQKRRLEEADIIVEMLFGRLSCYRRVLKRKKQYKNTNRPEMPSGCNEKVDYEFTKWIFIDGRTKEKVNHYKQIKKIYSDKTVIIRNQRQFNAFIKSKRKEAH